MIQRKKKQAQGGRWTRDPAKEAYWRKQLALWQQSGLSIRAFCREHGVVETSFYAWRRELIIRAREDGGADELTQPDRVTPNILTDGRGRKISIRYRETDQAAMHALLQDGSNPFVPIRLIHADEKLQAVPSGAMADGAGTSTSTKGIEIVLPGGTRITLGDDSNVRLVAELLSILKG
jgi:hypothetical protein